MQEKVSAGKVTPSHLRTSVSEDEEAGPPKTLCILSDPCELLSKASTDESGPNSRSPVLNVSADTAQPHALATPTVEPRASQRSHRCRTALPAEILGSFDAESQLDQLQKGLLEVKADLEREKSERAQRERQIRQDMYLEMLQAEEIAQRNTEKFERKLRLANKATDDEKQALAKLQEAFSKLSERHDSTEKDLTRHIAELDEHRQDIQHLQALNTTLEGDVEELRQIQNESLELKRQPGLPPPYGSLDEEDMPPYELHRDTGALHLANIKRGTRDQFNLDVRNMRYRDDGSPLSIEVGASESVQVFHATSHALFKAASNLSLFIRAWPTACFIDLDLSLQSTVDRVKARSSFIASRLSNLILELAWRTVSLNEVRPSIRNLSPRTLSVHHIMYSHIDDVLLEALRRWNGDGETNSNSMRSQQEADHRAEEFQVYLAQVMALGMKIEQLAGSPRNRSVGKIFAKTILFLQEAVENERMQQAKRSAESAEAEMRDAREVSVISSVGYLHDEWVEEFVETTLRETLEQAD